MRDDDMASAGWKDGIADHGARHPPGAYRREMRHERPVLQIAGRGDHLSLRIDHLDGPDQVRRDRRQRIVDVTVVDVVRGQLADRRHLFGEVLGGHLVEGEQQDDGEHDAEQADHDTDEHRQTRPDRTVL
ncbi:hypothetical protein FLW53_02550 [Microbispora sp. SCL1-1]|nr:hypothetical protein FLW53_02550 [Microbispora sp. SCL1-1]